MRARRMVSGAMVAAAIGGGLVIAGPATAHGGGERAEGGTSGKVNPALRGRGHKHGLRFCRIADDRLVAVDDHIGLTRMSDRLDEKVEEGKISRERADRILERRQKMVTIKVTMKDARWQPVLELFGVDSKQALREAIVAAGGIRALLEEKGKSRDDLRAALRAGRKAAKVARRELCSSAAEEPAPEKPAEPTPEPEA